MAQKIIPVSDFRRQTSQVIKTILRDGEVVCITQHGRPKIALVDYAEYEALQARVDSLEEQLRQREPAGSQPEPVASLALSVAVTASTARCLVDQEIVQTLGTGLASGEPALLLAQGRLVWRVPLILALPGLGMLGRVGVLEVDAQTAQLTSSYQEKQGIIQHAQRLYVGTTLSTE